VKRGAADADASTKLSLNKVNNKASCPLFYSWSLKTSQDGGMLPANK